MEETSLLRKQLIKLGVNMNLLQKLTKVVRGLYRRVPTAGLNLVRMGRTWDERKRQQNLIQRLDLSKIIPVVLAESCVGQHAFRKTAAMKWEPQPE